MKRIVCRSGMLLVLLAGACLPGLAEVSTDISPDGLVQIVVLGSTEGPDPFGMSWRPYRDIPTFRILNPYGDDRGDGRPAIGLLSDGPLVVSWAWNNGLDHDIAVSEWSEEGWTAPLFLTATGELDELDPRVLATDSGTVHLVWWTRQDQAIHHTSRQSDSNIWDLPSSRVTTLQESGRRPSVAIWDDRIHIAFERNSSQPDIAQEVVIKERTPSGLFTVNTVARTARAKRLDPVLHSESGWMWMDWKQSSDEFAYVVNGGEGWSEPMNIPWPDTSWVGVESVRQEIRQIVQSQGEALILSSEFKGGGNGSARPDAIVNNDLGLTAASAPIVSDVNQSSGSGEQRFKNERKRP